MCESVDKVFVLELCCSCLFRNIDDSQFGKEVNDIDYPNCDSLVCLIDHPWPKV